MRKAGKGQLPTLQKEDEGHYPQRVVNTVNCQWYDDLQWRKKNGTSTLTKISQLCQQFGLLAFFYRKLQAKSNDSLIKREQKYEN